MNAIIMKFHQTIECKYFFHSHLTMLNAADHRFQLLSIISISQRADKMIKIFFSFIRIFQCFSQPSIEIFIYCNYSHLPMSNITDYRIQFLLLKSADKRIKIFLSTIARHSIWTSRRRHRLEIEISLSLRISNISFIHISQCPTSQTIDFNFSQSFPSLNALRADHRFQIFLLLSPPPHRYPRVIASGGSCRRRLDG